MTKLTEEMLNGFVCIKCEQYIQDRTGEVKLCESCDKDHENDKEL